MDWQAIALTAKLALCTALLLLVLGLPLACWLAGTRWRGRIFIEAIVAMPLVLPPTVLGFYLLLAMGQKSPIGRWHEAVFGQTLAFSFRGLLIASLLYSLPFAVQPFTAALRGVDKSLVEAARGLGGTPLTVFRTVTVPLCWPGILAGVVLSFAHTLGEFGVALMVGGNIPGVTRTVSISIYDSTQALDYAAAGRTSLFLLALSFAVLSLVFALQRHLNFGGPQRP